MAAIPGGLTMAAIVWRPYYGINLQVKREVRASLSSNNQSEARAARFFSPEARNLEPKASVRAFYHSFRALDDHLQKCRSIKVRSSTSHRSCLTQRQARHQRIPMPTPLFSHTLYFHILFPPAAMPTVPNNGGFPAVFLAFLTLPSPSTCRSRCYGE